MKSSCRALIGILLAASWIATAQDSKPPVRVAVVGLSHDHAYGFFSLLRGRSDVEVTGVVETNRTLIATYTQRYNLSTNLFFNNMTVVEILDAAHESARTGRRVDLRPH